MGITKKKELPVLTKTFMTQGFPQRSLLQYVYCCRNVYHLPVKWMLKHFTSAEVETCNLRNKIRSNKKAIT